MTRLTLTRYIQDDHGTVGVLRAGPHRICWIVEPPDRGNQRNISCIPKGQYQVDYLEKSASGRYRDVYHIRHVPGRSGVLIHKGNYTGDRKQSYCSDSWGCLLPVDRLGVLACRNPEIGEQRVGLDSQKAMRLLHAATGREPFTLEIQ